MEPAVEPEFEALINAALAALGTGRQPDRFSFPNRIARKRALDATLLSHAARELGLEVWKLSGDMQIISGRGRTLGFYQNMPWTLSALDRLVTNNKELTKRILRDNGLPVAAGEVVESVADALACYGRIGPPAVVKPIVGSGGRGITVDIRSEAQLVAAAEAAFERNRRVLVEESIASIDLRIMVAGGRTAAGMMRVPAHVEGDGVSTIEELVAGKNRLRETNPYLRHVPITISTTATERLAACGLGLDSVLPAGERFFLHYKANLGSGGDSVNITDLVHPGILRLAERAVKCFGSANHAGVDILAQRFDQPPVAQRCVICEINLNNDMPIHVFPMFGGAIDVGRLELEGYFPPQRLSGLRRAGGQVRGRVRGRTSTAPVRRDEALTSVSDWPDLAAVLAKPRENPPGGAGGGTTLQQWDNQRLTAALASSGWQRVRVVRRLVYAEHGDHEVVLERSGRSVFASAIAERPEPLQALLAANGLAACRVARFRPGEWERVLDFFRGLPGPWDACPASATARGVTKLSFRKKSTLERVYSRLAGGRVPMLLKQAADQLMIRLLLVGTEVVGCILLSPPGLVGDGVSTVAQLIAGKTQARSQHPVLRHAPIPTSVLADANLSRRGLDSTTVLPAQRRVVLGRSPLPESGAEPVGFTDCPVDGLADTARLVQSLVGGPPVLSVTFAARPADSEVDARHWAVAAIALEPVIAEFAWPWAGDARGEEIYDAVAGQLRVGQRYELARAG